MVRALALHGSIGVFVIYFQWIESQHVDPFSKEVTFGLKLKLGHKQSCAKESRFNLYVNLS